MHRHAFASVMLLSANLTFAQSPYLLHEADASTGTEFRQEVGRTILYPLDKTWSQFTAEERSRLRAYYVGMSEADEPPFPEDGMAEIVRELAQRTGRLGYQGVLAVHVTVDAAGKAKSVDFLKYDDLAAAKALASVFVRIRYKPALCAGTPCEMKFPFYSQFQLR